ncbi:MAG: BlaI/MecI/CopY family transcriptional regulator [Myxococcota bacterium]
MSVAPPRLLGDLETEVMTVLWSYGPLSVRDVHAAIRRKPALAYTTVLTVLDRLHAKGLVERVKDGKAFVYCARLTREEWMGGSAAHMLTSGKEPPSTGVLLAFLDSAEKVDPQLVERLSELIAQRKGRDE